MGRLLVQTAPNGVPSLKCTTCQTTYPASTDHRPDSNDCIDAMRERNWSQSDD